MVIGGGFPESVTSWSLRQPTVKSVPRQWSYPESTARPSSPCLFFFLHYYCYYLKFLFLPSAESSPQSRLLRLLNLVIDKLYLLSRAFVSLDDICMGEPFETLENQEADRICRCSRLNLKSLRILLKSNCTILALPVFIPSACQKRYLLSKLRYREHRVQSLHKHYAYALMVSG